MQYLFYYGIVTIHKKRTDGDDIRDIHVLCEPEGICEQRTLTDTDNAVFPVLSQHYSEIVRHYLSCKSICESYN